MVPSSAAALPPSVGAASKAVPLTVKILTGSLHFTVLRAFPTQFKHVRHQKWINTVRINTVTTTRVKFIAKLRKICVNQPFLKKFNCLTIIPIMKYPKRLEVFIIVYKTCYTCVDGPDKSIWSFNLNDI